MPLWIAEQEALEDEGYRVEAGAPPRSGIEAWSEWRNRTDLDVQHALAFYGTYLVGQTSGFTEALSLPAVRAAFKIDGIQQDDQPELTRRLLMIHRWAVEVTKSRQRKHG